MELLKCSSCIPPVLTIHALVDKSAAPLIYVLLQDNIETFYYIVFHKILHLKITLNPLSIMAEFENACQNAVRYIPQPLSWSDAFSILDNVYAEKFEPLSGQTL
jgi:hypothetical protein